MTSGHLPGSQRKAIRKWRDVRAKEQNNKCYHCGCDITGCATADHLLPRSRGGQHIYENIVAACAPCNVRRDSGERGLLTEPELFALCGWVGA